MTQRLQIMDAEASSGGVVYLIVRDHDKPLLRREVEIVDRATEQYIALSGWTRGRSMVQFLDQEVRDGNLRITIDGPIVNELLSEYDQIRVTVPELGISENLLWPDVLACFDGNAVAEATTRIVSVTGMRPRDEEAGGSNNHDHVTTRGLEDERDTNNESGRSDGQSVGGDTEQETDRGRVMGAPPPPMWKVAAGAVASLVIGVAIGYFVRGALDSADPARWAELEEQLRVAQAERSAADAEVVALTGKLNSVEDDLEDSLAFVLERPTQDILDMLDGQTGQTDVSGYLDGEPIINPPGTRLYNAFFARYSARIPDNAANMPEPAIEEELFILREAVSFGSEAAMIALAVHMRDHVPHSRDSLAAAYRLFAQASNSYAVEGDVQRAIVLQQFAAGVLETYRDLRSQGG